MKKFCLALLLFLSTHPTWAIMNLIRPTNSGPEQVECRPQKASGRPNQSLDKMAAEMVAMADELVAEVEMVFDPQQVSYQSLGQLMDLPGRADDLPSIDDPQRMDWKCHVHYPSSDRVDPTPTPVHIKQATIAKTASPSDYTKSHWQIQDLLCLPAMADQKTMSDSDRLRGHCQKRVSDSYLLIEENNEDQYRQTSVSENNYIFQQSVHRIDSHHIAIRWRGEQAFTSDKAETEVIIFCQAPDDYQVERRPETDQAEKFHTQEKWYIKALKDFSSRSPEVQERYHRYYLNHEIAGRVVEKKQATGGRGGRTQSLTIASRERPSHIHRAEIIKDACEKAEQAGRLCGPGREIFDPRFDPLGERGNGLKQPFYRRVRANEYCHGRAYYRTNGDGVRIYTCSSTSRR